MPETFPDSEDDQQYLADQELEASEYGADQMAGMPGQGEVQDPYAAEVNQMAGDYEHDLMGVMEGQGAPEAAGEPEFAEELPGNDPWATAGGEYTDYEEEGPSGEQRAA